MKQCLNCNSENLMISEKESNLIPTAKYATCRSCGNVMFVINDALISTPTNDSARTKLLVQDAADCFNMNNVVASLDGRSVPVEIQPIQAIESIKEYVEQQLQKTFEEEEYEESIDDEMFEQEYDDELMLSDEEAKAIQDQLNGKFKPHPNYMILLHNSGEKHLYMNTSQDFMLNIINDIKEPFSLFELNHIKLKTEVKYSF